MPKNNPSKLAGLRMPDYSGSWWNQHFSNLTTMPVGKWCPVTVMDLPGGSLVKLKPNMRYEGLPQISPLYGGWTQRTKFYIAPYRLYIPELRKNLQQSWGSIPELPLPYMRYSCPINYSRYGADVSSTTLVYSSCSLAGSLLDRLGIVYGDNYSLNSFVRDKVVFPYVDSSSADGVVVLRSNVIPLLAYIDAWLYGEYNPQDKNIPVDVDYIGLESATNGSVLSRYTTTNFVSAESLKRIVPYFAFGDEVVDVAYGSYDMSFSVDSGSGANVINFDDKRINLISDYPLFSRYSLINSSDGMIKFAIGMGSSIIRPAIESVWSSLRNSTSSVGLLPVTYKGDYFTSWYSEEGISRAENYLVQHDETLLSLRRKNQDMLISLLSSLSGNRYVDYLQYIFDQDLELKDHPIMVGFDEIDFGGIDIVSNADTSDGSSSVGSTSILGGTAHKIKNYNSKVKPISFKLKEPSILLVCSSIIPNVYYWQGIPRFMFNQQVSDLWHPQYQKQGFMQTYRGEYYNPFSCNEVSSSSNYSLSVGDSDTQFFVKPEQVNRMAVSYVPLGWEHMERFNTLGGAMKTPAFKTWSLVRDFSSLSRSFYEGGISFGEDTSRLGFDSFFVQGDSYYRSTYVDSGGYNYMFNNVSRANSNNFIVRFSYDMSIYQPLVHTLIDKQGV